MVKNSKLLYKLYYHGGSLLLRGIGLFVKTDPNLILFSSYGGRKFDDSPRVVYEYLLQHPVSPDHKYVWAFANPDDFPEVENRIQVDTPAYYLTALRAGYWITNTSIARGMDFRKKQTKSFAFAHGLMALKRISTDVVDKGAVFISDQHEKFDAVFVEGTIDISILSRLWRLDKSLFHTTGLPRNDDLVDTTETEKLLLRQKLGIPEDKKVILYAPTFRDWSKDTTGQNTYRIPMDFTKWQKQLGKEYVLLVNGHYAISKLLNLPPKDDFVVNVFGYPQINDLLKIADILISDYSSIVFDYSILGRPIFGYCYDLDEYMAIRGSYIDVETFYCDGAIREEDDLLAAIVNIDYEKACKFTRENIRDRYLAAYGNAAEKSIEIMFGTKTDQN